MMSEPKSHPPDAPPFTGAEIALLKESLECRGWSSHYCPNCGSTIDRDGKISAALDQLAAMLDHYAAGQAQGTCETCKFKRELTGEDAEDFIECEMISETNSRSIHVWRKLNGQPFGCRAWLARPAAPGAQP